MNLQALPRRRSTYLQIRGVVRRGVALRGMGCQVKVECPTSVQRVSCECPASVQTLSQPGLSDGRGLTSVQRVSFRCSSSVQKLHNTGKNRTSCVETAQYWQKQNKLCNLVPLFSSLLWVIELYAKMVYRRSLTKNRPFDSILSVDILSASLCLGHSLNSND